MISSKEQNCGENNYIVRSVWNMVPINLFLFCFCRMVKTIFQILTDEIIYIFFIVIIIHTILYYLCTKLILEKAFPLQLNEINYV